MAQAKRTVTVFKTSVGRAEKFQSEASVFGELKHELGLNPDKEKIVIKETYTTLEQDLALLPEGDFLIFVSAKKTKSGAEDYTKMSYNDLRKLASSRLEKSPSKKDEIIKALIANDKKSNAKSPVEKKQVVQKTKGKVASKVLETVIPEGSFAEILKSHTKVLFDLSVGMNIILEETDSTFRVDTSFYDGKIEDLPVEQKAVPQMTEAQRKKKEQDELDARLAKEAGMIGM